MKLFGLGGMTLKSVFKRPETLQYPFQPTPQVEGRRGSVSIQIEDCIFCSACAKGCPAGAIDVDRDSESWSINHFSCVQCGACVDACPKSCLAMAEAVPSVGTQVAIETFTQAPEEV